MFFVLVSVLSAASLQASEQANFFTCNGPGVTFSYSASGFDGNPQIQATIGKDSYNATHRDDVKSQSTVIGEVVYLTDSKMAMVDGPVNQIGMVIPAHQMADEHVVELRTVVFKSSVAFFVPNVPLQLQHTDLIPVVCTAKKVFF